MEDILKFISRETGYKIPDGKRPTIGEVNQRFIDEIAKYGKILPGRGAMTIGDSIYISNAYKNEPDTIQSRIRVHELTHWLRRQNNIPDDLEDMEQEAESVADRWITSLINR